MSVSSVKVVLLKANLIYRQCFSLFPSLVPFSILREQDDLISYESDAPSKFVQIYLLTFLQNIARLTRGISNDCFILDVNRTSVNDCAGNIIFCHVSVAVKLVENGLFLWKRRVSFFRITRYVLYILAHIYIKYIIYYYHFIECVTTVLIIF